MSFNFKNAFSSAIKQCKEISKNNLFKSNEDNNNSYYCYKNYINAKMEENKEKEKEEENNQHKHFLKNKRELKDQTNNNNKEINIHEKDKIIDEKNDLNNSSEEEEDINKPTKKRKISESKEEKIIIENKEKDQKDLSNSNNNNLPQEIESNNNNNNHNNNNNNDDDDKEEKIETSLSSDKKALYKLTINPQEIIKVIRDRDKTKRIIEPNEFDYDYKCDELYNWLHLTFIEWEKAIQEEIESNKIDLEELKVKMGQYKQCRGYIKTLLINLKERKVADKILDKLFCLMVFCVDGDYIRAHDSYIDLSIGNSPWPMGVTMVGIHERSGRSRIANSQVAYILNDDITKKYLQSVKRVLTFIQKRFPKSPSQCVFS